MSTSRRTYSREFKEEALELYRTSGKSMAEIERDLGMSKGLLKHWLRQVESAGEAAFPGRGRLSAQDEELRGLRRENKILKQEREILKKALGIVSNDPKTHLPS